MSYRDVMRRLEALEHAQAAEATRPVITEVIIHHPEGPEHDEHIFLDGNWMAYRETGAPAHDMGDDDGR